MSDSYEVLHEMIDSYCNEIDELKKELLKQSAEIVRLSALLCEVPSCRTCKYAELSGTQLPCAACARGGNPEFEYSMWELKEGK